VEDRDPVELDDMAPSLPRAVVAIEDARFYEHRGFDLRGIARAIEHNLEEGRLAEGGSTITQQYVRNVLLTKRKTFKRKLREAVMAMQVEERYSKRTILERYLNTVYFGNGAYGVQAAARTYFGRDAHQLDLPQSATLAGLIRAPNDYDPFVHPDEAVARRNEVLARMRSLGRIGRAEAALARAVPLGLTPRADGTRYPAPLFVDKVKQFVFSDPRFGPTPADRERLLFQGGLTIETTLDPRWQFEAERALGGVLTDPRDPPGALVAVDPADGHVKAYASSIDYFNADPAYPFGAWRKFDLADARDGAGNPTRPPGSSFKPFVLATALERGVPLSRTYSGASPREIPPAWVGEDALHNFEDESYGRLNLTEATVNSVNTIYGQLADDVGYGDVAFTARAMGITTPLQGVQSIAIGQEPATLEDMAAAYSVFAADGVRHPAVFVTRITDRLGRVLYQPKGLPQRVLSSDTARTVSAVLQQVVQRGTAVNARIGRPAAGKTGTTDDRKDAWFVGYTPEIAAAVWTGFPDNTPMVPPRTPIEGQGGAWPAQIWQVFVSSVLADVPAVPFSVPEGTTTTTTRPVSTTTRPPAVPGLYSVIGLNVFDAVARLTEDGYEVELVHAPSRRYPPNTVTAQYPVEGTPLRRGGTVTVTVANGRPREVVVPSVLGLAADTAAGVVRDAGLVAELRVEVQPSPVPPDSGGRAWKQSPPSGSTLDEGSTVTVWVNP
jgi:penicillin-binding protein 1A